MVRAVPSQVSALWAEELSPIPGDTLWLHQVGGPPHRHLAKVTTRRLIFGGDPGTTPFDITGDGVPEDVTVADIYQRE
jgi:hypothetical protein